jgi:hypothetical protein
VPWSPGRSYLVYSLLEGYLAHLRLAPRGETMDDEIGCHQHDEPACNGHAGAPPRPHGFGALDLK